MSTLWVEESSVYRLWPCISMQQYGVTDTEEVDLVVGGQAVELVGMDLIATKQR